MLISKDRKQQKIGGDIIMVIYLTIVSIALLCASCITFVLKPRQYFNIYDMLVVITSVIIIIFTHMRSPLKYLTMSQEMIEYKKLHPEIDLSTPTALLKGIASGSITLTVTAALDSTGFGIFIVAANVLGVLHLSFQAMSTSMVILGLILQPWIYVPFAILTAIWVTLSKMEKGNDLLDKSLFELKRKNYQKAYAYAIKASKKWIFVPSEEKVREWKYYVEAAYRYRIERLNRLKVLAERFVKQPIRWCYYGIIYGSLFGVIIAIILSYFNYINVVSILVIIIASCAFCMERNFSWTLCRIVIYSSVLTQEVAYYEQLICIKLHGSSIEDLKIKIGSSGEKKVLTWKCICGEINIKSRAECRICGRQPIIERK